MLSRTEPTGLILACPLPRHATNVDILTTCIEQHANESNLAALIAAEKEERQTLQKIAAQFGRTGGAA